MSREFGEEFGNLLKVGTCDCGKDVWSLNNTGPGRQTAFYCLTEDISIWKCEVEHLQKYHPNSLELAILTGEVEEVVR